MARLRGLGCYPGQRYPEKWCCISPSVPRHIYIGFPALAAFPRTGGKRSQIADTPIRHAAHSRLSITWPFRLNNVLPFYSFQWPIRHATRICRCHSHICDRGQLYSHRISFGFGSFARALLLGHIRKAIPTAFTVDWRLSARIRGPAGSGVCHNHFIDPVVDYQD